MAEDHDVKARLVFDTKQAKKEAREFAAEARRTQKAIDETNKSAARLGAGRAATSLASLQKQLIAGQNAALGLGRSLFAIGAAYVGFQALSTATRVLVGDTLKYSASLEQAKVSLTSVLQAVQGGDWQSVAVQSDEVFESLRREAIKSVATTQELFQIFSGIVGPIMHAGYGLEAVKRLTTDTVSAATALGVDFAQAQRDISMMVRGTAGMDVKLFSMLRSTGAIVEDAQEWNKLMTSKRVEKLQSALAKFAPAGERFAHTWAGLTSTFKDIADQMRAAAFAPILRRMEGALERVNNQLIEHQDQLQAYLGDFGERAGVVLDRWIDRAAAGFTYIIENWDSISRRIGDAVEGIKTAAPILLQAAVALEAVSLGRKIGGATSDILGALAGGAAGFGGGALAAGAAASSTGPVIAAGELGAGLAGDFVIGATPGAGMVAPDVAMFAASGAATEATGAFAGLAPVLGIAAAAVAVLAGVWLAVEENLASLSAIWTATTSGISEDLGELMSALWGGLAPILKAVGGIVGGLLVGAFTLLMPIIRVAIEVLTVAAQAFEGLVQVLTESLSPAIDTIMTGFRAAAEFMMDLARKLVGFFGGEMHGSNEAPATAIQFGEANISGGGPIASMMTPEEESALAYKLGMDSLRAKPKPERPKSSGGGTVNHNDFRGSHIKIEQKFEGDHDPDRVVYAMMNDLVRQAENRISSAYSGALTR